MSRSDLPTLITCLACDGEYQIVTEQEDGTYRTHTCRWCTVGTQTPAQIRAWTEFSERRKTDPEFKITE